ncbi:hypothetical protein TRFO_29438 [Tritrichomonas foetus]|uniref:Uncharacterized protein n=1 Tax=Tritrichomonas foetus TaxID=1144522 RepID=A0A1J4K0E4_9EUKA|nr:hypothetical protein TRFO_29438 [Tritrichomonas foetus]|eukprot:OHT03244.1 hypothetical protein TRFO_29438 [Tritrichomonas foetus]
MSCDTKKVKLNVFEIDLAAIFFSELFCHFCFNSKKVRLLSIFNTLTNDIKPMSHITCYVISDIPFHQNPKQNSFYIAKSNGNEILPVIYQEQENPYLIHFRFEENPKVNQYLLFYDQNTHENEGVPFCKIPRLISILVCSFTKNQLSVHQNYTQKMKWLNLNLTLSSDISICLNFAFLPHKFNRFFYLTRKVKKASKINEFRNLIFSFRPNGKFLPKEHFFRFLLQFILYYNDNENAEFVKLPLFRHFIFIIFDEFFEIERFIEASTISFVTKEKMECPTPLECQNFSEYDFDSTFKFCNSVVSLFGISFLIWSYTVQYNTMFEMLFEEWFHSCEINIEDVFDLMLRKLKTNDFSEISLKLFLKFTKKFIKDENKEFIREKLQFNEMNLSPFVIFFIKNIILESQNESNYENIETQMNDQINIQITDLKLLKKMNEMRGIWFNMPELCFYHKEDNLNNHKMLTPTFSFRSDSINFRKKQTTVSSKNISVVGTNRKVFSQNRPNNRRIYNP